MGRIRFVRGGQRKFLDLVIERLSATSLRGILQFGFDVPYSTLKNYYNESRLLPEDFFNNLCDVANIDKTDLSYEEVEDNWGRVKGGKLGKRRGSYHKSFEDYVFNIEKFFLGKISYATLSRLKRQNFEGIYEVFFETKNFEEFRDFLYSFFEDKKMVELRLNHEAEHYRINKKYGVSSRFVLKRYFKNGKFIYRPSVSIGSSSIMTQWSLKKHWNYFYENTSMDNASDMDKRIFKVLLKFGNSKGFRKI